MLGALLDGFDLVVAAPDRKVRPADARRLTARARERGTVVVLAGGGAVSAWPEGADLRLALTVPDWEGLGRGHGHLQRRRVHLEVTGRREAARPRAADLWLPAESTPVDPVEPLELPFWRLIRRPDDRISRQNGGPCRAGRLVRRIAAFWRPISVP